MYRLAGGHISWEYRRIERVSKGGSRGQTCCPTRRSASAQTKSPLPLTKTTTLPLSTQSFKSQCWAQIYRFSKTGYLRTNNSQVHSNNKVHNPQKSLFLPRAAKISPSPVSSTTFKQNGGDTNAIEMSGKSNVQRCGFVSISLPPFPHPHISFPSGSYSPS